MTKLTDEQIQKGCDEAYKRLGLNAYFGNGFKAGVEFALSQVNNLSISGVIVPLICDCEHPHHQTDKDYREYCRKCGKDWNQAN